MKTTLTITLLFLSIHLYSQKLGVKAGFTLSKIESINANFGFSGGLFFETKKNIYFVSELNFKTITGSITIHITNSVGTQTGSKRLGYSYYMLELPLMVGFRNIEKKGLRPFVNLGASPAIVIGSRFDKNRSSNYDNFNLSLLLSPGLMMSDRVSIEARLNKSISGLNYTSFSFLLGVRF